MKVSNINNRGQRRPACDAWLLRFGRCHVGRWSGVGVHGPYGPHGGRTHAHGGRGKSVNRTNRPRRYAKAERSVGRTYGLHGYGWYAVRRAPEISFSTGTCFTQNQRPLLPGPARIVLCVWRAARVAYYCRRSACMRDVLRCYHISHRGCVCMRRKLYSSFDTVSDDESSSPD